MSLNNSEPDVPTFPDWPGDRILIVGSSDIFDQRVETEQIIWDALKLGPVTDKPIHPYSWDIDTNECGLNQKRTMQEGIPLPSKPGCLGVICIMGERIGHAFDHAFQADQVIDNLYTWTDPTRGYRLVHPWPEGQPERRMALEAGGFPLTGNTFEFLCSLESNTPTWLCFLTAGDPTDPATALNHGHWRTARSKEELSDEEFDRWLSNEYFEQTTAVRNFARALSERSRSLHPIADGRNLKSKIKSFVLREVLPGRRVGNPYRFLSRYEPEHGSDFVGREDETLEVVELLLGRLRSHQPASACITGKSGIGKSSLLRAGVVHELRKRAYRGRYKAVPISPIEELHHSPDRPAAVLESLLTRVLHATGLPLMAGDLDGLDRPGVVPEQRAVDLLTKALETMGSGYRLVLAVDQFEEIIDQMAGPRGKKTWLPLLRFLQLAARSGRIGVAYTLEDERLKAAENMDLGGLLSDDNRVELDNDTNLFFKTVITKPFRQSGFPLSPKVVNELMNQVKVLRGDSNQHRNHAVLPILSMLLHDLYEHVSISREPLDESLVKSLEDPSGTTINEDLCVKVEEVKRRLSYQDVVSRIIKRACRRGGLSADAKGSDLDPILLPLVGVGGTDQEQVELRQVELPAYRADRRVIESFRRSRLVVQIEGKIRLTHQAVLEAWPETKDWLETSRPYLKTRHHMLQCAQAWVTGGRQNHTATQEEIADGAEVLAYSSRDWAHPSSRLTQEDQILREYCVELFSQAQDGTQVIRRHWKGNHPPTRHVHLAASYGYIKLLERFASQDPACLSMPGGISHRPPLGYASWTSSDAVEWLLKQNYCRIDPLGMDQAPDRDNWPAIAAPILEGNTKIFMKLIRAAGDSLPGCPRGATLLHCCARYNRKDFAQILMGWDDQINPTQRDRFDYTPLEYAASYGSDAMFDFLLEWSDPFDTHPDYRTNCLHRAAQSGHLAIIKRMRDLDGFEAAINQCNYRGGRPLTDAAGKGHADCVREILNYTPPTEAAIQDDWIAHALEAAIPTSEDEYTDEEDVLNTVEVLLQDERTDPNIVDRSGRTMLDRAKWSPKLRRRLLDDARLKPDMGEHTSPLLIAAEIGYWSAYRRLMQSFIDQADPEQLRQKLSAVRNYSGSSLLHFLIRPSTPSDLLEQHLSIVAKEDLHPANDEGVTPALAAITQENYKALQDLLDKNGTKPHIEDPSILKPDSKTQAMKLLLAHDPEAFSRPGPLGWTIMHNICMDGQLKHYGDVTSSLDTAPQAWVVPDPFGRRPIDILHPAKRDGLPGAADAADWPELRHWDDGISWQTLPPDERAGLIEKIEPDDKRWPLSDQTQIESTGLPFYHEPVRLVRLHDEAWPTPGLRIYFLVCHNKPYRLSGKSIPIHEVNSQRLDPDDDASPAVLHLNEQNATDYLRFFCFFVWGEEGPFWIHERFDTSALNVTEDTEQTAIDVIKQFARPAWRLPARGEKSVCLLSAMVYYSDAIFTSLFSVHSDGMVEMIDDTPLAADLGVRVSLPLA